MRPKRTEPAVEIPSDRWAFARLENGKLIADPGSIWVKDGIRPGWPYDLVYVGRDPRAMGLGLAVLRDCASFFRYDASDRRENRNPLAGFVDHAYIFGISQSGRVVRHFLFGGFNSELRGSEWSSTGRWPTSRGADDCSTNVLAWQRSARRITRICSPRRSRFP